MQYRSKLMDPATFVVGGYQADIDMGADIGMLYEEKARGILMQPDRDPHQPGQCRRCAQGRRPEKSQGAEGQVDTIATLTTTEELAAAYKKASGTSCESSPAETTCSTS